jgi:hypothetical protein
VPFGSTKIAFTIEVADDSTTEFFSQIEAHCAPCTKVGSYKEDSAAPWIAIEDLLPRSPANGNDLLLIGRTEPNAEITIFDDGSCAHPIRTFPAGSHGTFKWTTQVPDDSRSVFTAAAEDGAGNVSRCSWPVEYIEDSSL